LIFSGIQVAEAGTLDTNLVKSNPIAEEAPLQISADKIGTLDITSYIGGQILYIPIGELFSRLRIDYNYPENNYIMKGFFVDENTRYNINILENYATINERKITFTREDFYVTETEIYLNSDLYDKIFWIKLDLNKKELKAYLSSKVKLPIVTEIEMNILRSNREQNQQDSIKADYYAGRNRKLLGLGAMDWGLNYSHTSPDNEDYNYNLSLGSEILGGDLNAFITGNRNNVFDNANWRWRFVDDKKYFKQAILGNLNLNSGLLFNAQGFQITNSPPIARRTIGKYKIFDRINPYWDVELYINNEFIAYTKANSNGYFEFNVPLLYGSNYITLKYYGASGEIRNEERVIQVPFNFIPEGTLEYNISGGTLKYGDHNAFSESSLFWGATSFLTLGSGLTYLNAPGINKYYPFVNASVRVMDNIILSGNYFPDLKDIVSVSLLLPSQIFTSFSFIKHKSNSFFNPLNFTEERNLSAFVPLSFKNFSTSFRISASNVISDNYKFIFLNTGLFVNYKRFQGSIMTNATWSDYSGKYVDAGSKSSVSLSYRLLSDLLVRQQTDIDHFSGKVTNAGIYLDKSIFKTGWLSFFVFRDFVNKSYYGGLTFRFDFPFTRYSAGYSAANTGWNFQQSLFGSVGFDQFKQKFVTDNQNMVSRGGLTLVPFIDLNNNDIMDDNEHYLKTEFSTKLNAGKLIRSSDKNDLWYVDLDPYNTYRLEVIPVSFDNPMYRPKYKTYAVTVDPNGFKFIPVPVFISGIISGNVKLNTEKGMKGIPSMKIILESIDGKQKFEKFTFSDGEYIFDNVPPGNYKLYPDPQELNKRSITSEPEYQLIEVKQLEEGDIIDGIDIYMKRK
jgi:hypothetical protein